MIDINNIKSAIQLGLGIQLRSIIFFYIKGLVFIHLHYNIYIRKIYTMM